MWSPWHRVEVFNTLRQLSLHPDRKRQLAPGESKAAIQQIETDVRVGYFTHMEADWRDVLRKFNDLSIEHGFSQPCRSADILHVAYATELSAERFIGFDDDQLALAKAAGLDTLRPR